MTRHLRPVAIAVALLAVASLGVAACSDDGGAAPPATTDPGAATAVTYVALGGTESNGGRERLQVGETWPQLLFRAALPPRAIFVNLARNRSTIAAALADQVPEAVGLHPTVATVWFGTADAFSRTDLDRFEADLANAVQQLQTAGAQVVVVMGPPPPDSGVDTGPYTDRARVVAEANDAGLVDLRDQPVTGEAQQAIADEVADAIGPIP